MINHPRGSIHLSPYREFSWFWVGQELHIISWQMNLITVLPCNGVTKNNSTFLIAIYSATFITIICCILIFFFHLYRLQPSDFFPSVCPCTHLNAFFNSLVAVTCPPKSPPLFLSTSWYFMDRQNSWIYMAIGL
jgi:hypothetical protein